jgi:hypothetical protein
MHKSASLRQLIRYAHQWVQAAALALSFQASQGSFRGSGSQGMSFWKKGDVCQTAGAGLRVNPVLNNIFEWFLSFELSLIRAGVCLPAGGSRLLFAVKPATIRKDS